MKNQHLPLVIFRLTFLVMLVVANLTNAQSNYSFSSPLPTYYSGRTTALNLITPNAVVQAVSFTQAEQQVAGPATVQAVADAPQAKREVIELQIPSRPSVPAVPAAPKEAGSPTVKPAPAAQPDLFQLRTSALDDVYDGLPKQAEEEDELQEHVEALDRLLESSTLQRILSLMAENVEMRAEMRVQQIEHKMQLQLMEIKLDRAQAQTQRAEEPTAASPRPGPVAGRRVADSAHGEVEGLHKELELAHRELQATRAARERNEQNSNKSQQLLKQNIEQLTDELRQAERGKAEAERRAAGLERQLLQLQQRTEQAQKKAAERAQANKSGKGDGEQKKKVESDKR